MSIAAFWLSFLLPCEGKVAAQESWQSIKAPLFQEAIARAGDATSLPSLGAHSQPRSKFILRLTALNVSPPDKLTSFADVEPLMLLASSSMAACHPPELSNTWHFIWRTARFPRAP